MEWFTSSKKKSYHTSLPPFQLIYDNRIMQVFLF